MKRIVLAFLAIGMVYACNSGESGDQSQDLSTDLVNNPLSGEESDPTSLPTLTLDEPEYDFGTISQGEKVEKSFTFKNTGKSDLIISNATGSCGCTVPTWPSAPIKPGETGVIEVVFNSEGKSGHQEKTVTVMANTQPNRSTIKIYGEVNAPEQQ
ncbi:MAG: DUF1573 domain-containing protein [Flavobacteriales bacterium]|nr:DUF1573 domain-containing protein [Flavobacteriales bacterium]